MLKRQACAKFQSKIYDESEVIQILKVVRWHFCQVYLGYVSLLIFMIFKSSCIGFKSRKSPAHSQTDILLISIMYFAD